MAGCGAGSTREGQEPLVALRWGESQAEAFQVAWMPERGEEGKGDSVKGGTGPSFACSTVSLKPILISGI